MTQRVIKFRRAYFNYDGSFWGFKEWGPEGTGFISPSYIHGCKSGEDQQFTGLHDKHGKEIYHKDFIKSNGGDIMLVVWRDDLASFALRKKGWAYDHYFGEAVDPGNTEVVGNIYTNPELIENGNS